MYDDFIMVTKLIFEKYLKAKLGETDELKRFWN